MVTGRQLRLAAVDTVFGLPGKRAEAEESSEASDETVFLDMLSSSVSSGPGVSGNEAEAMSEAPSTPTAGGQVCIQSSD